MEFYWAKLSATYAWTKRTRNQKHRYQTFLDDVKAFRVIDVLPFPLLFDSDEAADNLKSNSASQTLESTTSPTKKPT